MKATMKMLAAALAILMALGLAGAMADGRTAMVGEKLTFGRYEQDGNDENGPESIEWQVVDVNGGRALLVSVKGLESMPYHAEKRAVTWKNCTSRSWLNNAFLYSAFTGEEREAILLTKVSNATWDGNVKWDTTNGAHTQDRVFLLSYSEVERYFPNSRHRQIEPSVHVSSEDPKTRVDDGAWWWLRSAGHTQQGAAVVRADGTMGQSRTVNNPHGMIRPAMWVQVDRLP